MTLQQALRVECRPRANAPVGRPEQGLALEVIQRLFPAPLWVGDPAELPEAVLDNFVLSLRRAFVVRTVARPVAALRKGRLTPVRVASTRFADVLLAWTRPDPPPAASSPSV